MVCIIGQFGERRRPSIDEVAIHCVADEVVADRLTEQRQILERIRHVAVQPTETARKADLTDLSCLNATRAGLLEIVTPDALIQNVTLNPSETFSVDLQFQLPRAYPLQRGPFPEFDLIQIGAGGDPDAVVGGQRFVLDFSKLILVKSSDYWRYWDEDPGPAWTSSDYDDSGWKLGKAEFVFAKHSDD